MAAIPDADALRAVDRAREGNVGAFLAVVREYEPTLRGLVAKMLGRREDVPDVLQETFLRAFRALPGFRGEASLETWLYRIAYNVCLDELRRRQHRLVPLDEAVERAEALDDPLAALTAAASLAAALAALSPEERGAVLLVDGEGYDYVRAGEVLGVPAGTVASRLHRARAVLRRALADVGEGVEVR